MNNIYSINRIHEASISRLCINPIMVRWNLKLNTFPKYNPWMSFYELYSYIMYYAGRIQSSSLGTLDCDTYSMKLTLYIAGLCWGQPYPKLRFMVGAKKASV